MLLCEYKLRGINFKEALIKYGASDVQSDFLAACIKTTQAYLVYGKEFLCKMTENMQADDVPS